MSVEPREPEPTERRMTLEEWARLDEDEPGEWMDGVVVEDEVPGFVHEIVVGFVIELFRAWLRLRGGGFVGGSDAKFAVRRGRGRKPDVSVYFAGGRMPERHGLITVPPNVMVEVLSPTPRDGRRDRVEKVGEYAAFGVAYYWLIDPDTRTFEVLELGADGRYVHALSATDGVLTSVPGCEGLTLDLDALWGEIDRLGPEPPPEGR